MARVIAWLAVALIVLQLLGATQHRHDLGRHVAGCAACVLGARLDAPPFDPAIAVVLVQLAVVQYFLSAHSVTDGGISTSVPIPRAQGPPVCCSHE